MEQPDLDLLYPLPKLPDDGMRDRLAWEMHKNDDWRSGYPPSNSKQAVSRHWIGHQMESKALCLRHKRWERVTEWQWKGWYVEERPFNWLILFKAYTVTHCICYYTIDPAVGVKVRHGLPENRLLNMGPPAKEAKT